MFEILNEDKIEYKLFSRDLILYLLRRKIFYWSYVTRVAYIILE